MDIILSRRSIREYIDKPVEEDKIRYLMEAAMSAPSAHNEQPWVFVVIDDKSLLTKITGFHPYSKMLLDAPLAILVCADTEHLVNLDYFQQDCAAATENILLAANSSGLGGVWLGVYPKKDIIKGFSDLLGLPEGVIPFGLVSIGYPGVEKEPSARFDESRIHRNSWQ